MNAATLPPPRRRSSVPPDIPAILTAEEFINLPDTRGLELDRGRIVELPVPGFNHGVVCAETARVIANFVKEHDLGRVLTNDSHLQVPSLDDSGVDVVALIDPERRTAHVFTPEEELPDPLADTADLTPGDFLPGFSVRLADLLDS